MKKILAFVFSALAVLFVNLPFNGIAEAARVAVLPLQMDDQKIERAGDFSNYYWDIMVEKFKYPEYELMDDGKVIAAIPDTGLQTFDKATLAGICEKTDADIVVVMQLNKISERPLNFRREPAIECRMQAEYAGYNRLTDHYYYKNMNFKDEIEEVLLFKNDWQREAFASNLKRYIYRTLEEKKKK